MLRETAVGSIGYDQRGSIGTNHLVLATLLLGLVGGVRLTLEPSAQEAATQVIEPMLAATSRGGSGLAERPGDRAAISLPHQQASLRPEDDEEFAQRMAHVADGDFPNLPPGASRLWPFSKTHERPPGNWVLVKLPGESPVWVEPAPDYADAYASLFETWSEGQTPASSNRGLDVMSIAASDPTEATEQSALGRDDDSPEVVRAHAALATLRGLLDASVVDRVEKAWQQMHAASGEDEAVLREKTLEFERQMWRLRQVIARAYVLAEGDEWVEPPMPELQGTATTAHAAEGMEYFASMAQLLKDAGLDRHLRTMGRALEESERGLGD